MTSADYVTNSRPATVLAFRLALAAITMANTMWSLPGSAAPPTRIASSDAPTALIELYTSEGCSSCPPADRWLSTLRDDPRLWQAFVPVAFHVDYWDYIGWHDPYSSPMHTARQRAYVATNAVSQAYTPGFVLSGREWRGWFKREDLNLPRAPAIGRLVLELQEPESGQAEISFTPLKMAGNDLRYTVALLGFDLRTAVSRGENAGRELHHDFVVLATREGDLPRADAGYRAVVTLPASRQHAARYALGVWVSRGRDPAPLQAAGGWIPATRAIFEKPAVAVPSPAGPANNPTPLMLCVLSHRAL